MNGLVNASARRAYCDLKSTYSTPTSRAMALNTPSIQTVPVLWCVATTTLCFITGELIAQFASTLCELLYTDWKIFTRCGRRVPPTQEVAARGDAERKEALAYAGRPVDEGRGIGRQQRRQDVGAGWQVRRQQVGGGEDGKTGCILHSSIVRSSFNRVNRYFTKTDMIVFDDFSSRGSPGNAD